MGILGAEKLLPRPVLDGYRVIRAAGSTTLAHMIGGVGQETHHLTDRLRYEQTASELRLSLSGLHAASQTLVELDKELDELRKKSKDYIWRGVRETEIDTEQRKNSALKAHSQLRIAELTAQGLIGSAEGDTSSLMHEAALLDTALGVLSIEGISRLDLKDSHREILLGALTAKESQ